MSITTSDSCSAFSCVEDVEQFLAAVAHDLKEPLRTIQCYAELLTEQWGASGDDETRLPLTFIRDSTMRMQKLVEDAMAFAEVGGSGVGRSKVEMEKVLDFTLGNLESAITETKATITRDSLPVVTADFVALARVFQNLIANAIAYRSGELPRVHVGCIRGKDWLFSVADNGVGIDPAFIEYVFQPLKRLHSQWSRLGTGLGLAICRKIVESHGGRIWLESQPDVGSTFYFSLPAVEEVLPDAMRG